MDYREIVLQGKYGTKLDIYLLADHLVKSVDHLCLLNEITYKRNETVSTTSSSAESILNIRDNTVRFCIPIKMLFHQGAGGLLLKLVLVNLGITISLSLSSRLQNSS
ncbi:unnamed protein product [Colias eurytheme]|nr:unnamed protein product [Colias eurytheme]